MQLLSSYCGFIFEQHYGVLLTLFLAGLAGGFTHCGSMCSPFVLAQIGPSGQEGTLSKLKGAALLPYHLGRMTTYMFLGSLACVLSKQIIGQNWHKVFVVLMLSAAAIVFIVNVFPSIKKHFKFLPNLGFAKIGQLIGVAAKPFFKKSNPLNNYMLGVMLGFIPCGLIFAALMMVATTKDVAAAIFAMALFTLGTFPALFAVGLAGKFAFSKYPAKMKLISNGLMLLNAFGLFFIASKYY